MRWAHELSSETSQEKESKGSRWGQGKKGAIIWFWMKSNFSPIPRRSLRHKLPGRVCPALKKGNKAFVTPNPSQLLTIGYLGLWVERESSQNVLAKQFLVKVNLPGKAAE